MREAGGVCRGTFPSRPYPTAKEHAIPFREDLRWLAAENFAIAGRLCDDSCGHMHALWPYIRLARASIGAEGVSSSPLDPLLATLVAEGRRSVLIAGSQDTGLLALVARAGEALDIEVLDRCPTPLETCRRLARSWSLPLKTVQADLMELDVPERFDIVLVHGTLQFLPAARRANVLGRLRRALRPAGRLVLFFHTSPRLADDLAAEARAGYGDWVIAELEHLGIPLPEARADFAARLRAHAENRERRLGSFATIEDVHTLLATAGFTVCQSLEISATVSDRMQEFVTKLSQRRFVVSAAA
jgi:SAM-dependent methyltransferase